MLDMINTSKSRQNNVTHFDNSDRAKPSKTFSKFQQDNTISSSDVKDGISTINSIASKYSARVSSFDHVVDRFKRDAGKADREYSMDDLVTLFKGIEKNTNFFSELDKASSKGADDLSRRVQLIDTTRKTHLIVHVTKRGKKYDIITRTLMGKYRMSDINRMRTKDRIPTYFTR